MTLKQIGVSVGIGRERDCKYVRSGWLLLRPQFDAQVLPSQPDAIHVRRHQRPRRYEQKDTSGSHSRTTIKGRLR